jgi:N-acetyl sugar amidotransferase
MNYNINRKYKMCTRCVMDTSDIEIIFDEDGVCNYCLEADIELPKYQLTAKEEKCNLDLLKNRLFADKKGKYDSILGLSGGVDSSYVAYLAMKMGLNPLCVHFDNGWNSETAVQNIHKIINITGFDLETYVINWPEFRDLQRSFFKASVIDIEMLTDQAIFSSLFKIRKENNIKTVLSGTNYATEHGLPKSWLWMKMDTRNIRAIQKRFGSMKIESFPTMNSLSWLLMKRFNLGGVFEEPLNIINFRKNDAMAVLTKVFDWKYYGGKHYESIFTKFYQAYVLPTKFGIDKRKAHYSALIRNNEITRDKARDEVSQPLYNSQELEQDKSYVLKKLGFSEIEFDEIMKMKPVPHDYYPTDQTYIRPLIYLNNRFLKGKK